MFLLLFPLLLPREVLADTAMVQEVAALVNSDDYYSLGIVTMLEYVHIYMFTLHSCTYCTYMPKYVYLVRENCVGIVGLDLQAR